MIIMYIYNIQAYIYIQIILILIMQFKTIIIIIQLKLVFHIVSWIFPRCPGFQGQQPCWRPVSAGHLKSCATPGANAIGAGGRAWDPWDPGGRPSWRCPGCFPTWSLGKNDDFGELERCLNGFNMFFIGIKLDKLGEIWQDNDNQFPPIWVILQYFRASQV